MANILGGLSRFEVSEGGNEDDVTSYLIGLSGRLKIGRGYISGGGWIGQNAGNLIDQYVSLRSSGQHWANWDGSTLTDNDGSGFYFSAGYVVSQMLRFEGGYGYSKSELDTAGAQKDDAQVYYLQSTITLAPGVMVVPEAGVIDFKQTGQLTTTYFGMKWQINF